MQQAAAQQRKRPAAAAVQPSDASVDGDQPSTRAPKGRAKKENLRDARQYFAPARGDLGASNQKRQKIFKAHESAKSSDNKTPPKPPAAADAVNGKDKGGDAAAETTGTVVARDGEIICGLQVIRF